jgi:hypothetical protein
MSYLTSLLYVCLNSIRYSRRWRFWEGFIKLESFDWVPILTVGSIVDSSTTCLLRLTCILTLSILCLFKMFPSRGIVGWVWTYIHYQQDTMIAETAVWVWKTCRAGVSVLAGSDNKWIWGSKGSVLKLDECSWLIYDSIGSGYIAPLGCSPVVKFIRLEVDD